MEYAVTPDEAFLADSLAGLTRLNLRHFAESPNLAAVVLQRFLDRSFRWHNETPDSWQDVTQLGDSKIELFDCEDFAAAFAALIVCVFGDAKVGIRRTGTNLCHAIVGRGNDIFDICILLDMPGRSSGPVTWREVKGAPMLAEGLTLITAGVKRLMNESKEAAPSTGAVDDETGASLANVLMSFLPPAMIDKVERLERNEAALRKEVAAKKATIAVLTKELAAAKKGLSTMTASRDDQSVKRINAESAEKKTKEQLAAESRRLVESRAFHESCKAQLAELKSKTKDPSVIALIDEASQRLEQEKPEDIADLFADEEQRTFAWDTLGMGAAHLESLPCCAACGAGEECEKDEACGSEPPTTGAAFFRPDAFVTGLPFAPPENGGCGGACPR